MNDTWWLQRFERRVADSSAQPAVVEGDLVLTYRELDRWVDRIAGELAEIGVTQGDSVAVVVSRGRGTYATAALLAIWRLGAVYVPLAADQPEERIRNALALVPVRVALLAPGARDTALRETVAAVIPGPGTGAARAPVRRQPLTPDDLAYIIFTSGSSGTPKGVAIPHRGLTALADCTAQALLLRAGARLLQFAAATFDASIVETIAALGSGATAVFARAEQLADGDGIADVLVRQRITHAIMVPSVLAAVPERRIPPGLRLMIAGEPADPAMVEQWSARHALINGYGTTETTVCATISDPLHDVATSIPIGRPITGTTVRIVDDCVAAGTTGELWVGGAGIARGYAGSPSDTALAFVAGPDGRRWYRTGDRVRRLPDGQLEFLGRRDRQIKLRGRRIEPAEIEAVALSCAGVRRAAVVATRTQLVCFVVPADSSLELPRARAYLTDRLPSHLLPDRFELLAELPCTPHGKLDYRGLEELAGRQRMSCATAEMPTPRAQLLCELFADVLELPSVRADDDFFELGGESMSAAVLARRIRDTLGIDIPMRTLLEIPTPAGLAAVDAAPVPQSPAGG